MPGKAELQLIRACSTGKVATALDLLQQGLSADTRDQYGLTGRMWAARKRQIEIGDR